jgi:AcrR family transcriptional regulator
VRGGVTNAIPQSEAPYSLLREQYPLIFFWIVPNPPPASPKERAAPIGGGDAGPRRVRKGGHRQLLINAAIAVFSECGESASIEQIVRRAGVHKPSLFYHFASKHDLYLAAVSVAAARVRERFAAHVREYEPPARVAQRLVQGERARTGEVCAQTQAGLDRDEVTGANAEGTTTPTFTGASPVEALVEVALAETAALRLLFRDAMGPGPTGLAPLLLEVLPIASPQARLTIASLIMMGCFFPAPGPIADRRATLLALLQAIL